MDEIYEYVAKLSLIPCEMFALQSLIHAMKEERVAIKDINSFICKALLASMWCDSTGYENSAKSEAVVIREFRIYNRRNADACSTTNS